MKLIEGTSDEPVGGESSGFYKLNFDNYFMTLDLTKHNEKVQKKPKSMTLAELKAQIQEFDKLFINTDQLRTEYLRKISWSFAPLLFMMLGFPLAVMTHKREKSANVIIAILCAAAYYLLTLGAEALASEGTVPAEIIMWVPNLLTAGVAGYLIYKCVY
jgi:lipopolysaccharide export system permease protein